MEGSLVAKIVAITPNLASPIIALLEARKVPIPLAQEGVPFVRYDASWLIQQYSQY